MGDIGVTKANALEAFSIFDDSGEGTISIDILGTVIRALGWNPSDADVLVRSFLRIQQPIEAMSRSTYLCHDC